MTCLNKCHARPTDTTVMNCSYLDSQWHVVDIINQCCITLLWTPLSYMFCLYLCHLRLFFFSLNLCIHSVFGGCILISHFLLSPRAYQSIRNTTMSMQNLTALSFNSEHVHTAWWMTTSLLLFSEVSSHIDNMWWITSYKAVHRQWHAYAVQIYSLSFFMWRIYEHFLLLF